MRPSPGETAEGGRALHDAGLGAPRWRGQPGRVEVWYATFTGADGTGYWVHYETVAPTDGAPYAHGWAAVFPPDDTPVVERFGPEPVTTPAGTAWFETAAATIGPGRLTGTTGTLAWDLDIHDGGSPLWTFPRSVWQRELLPGAQVVPWPRATVRGTFRSPAGEHEIDANGAVARIYGHGNAERWCWLHADLGDGAVAEVVAAAPRRAGLRRLPLVPMVQLRIPGASDWPANPLAAALGFRARRTSAGFRVSGLVGRRRLRIDVSLPKDRCVALRYTDPDGATATCTNSERADAEVVVERWRRRWVEERRWSLDGTAHAEIGTRP